MISRKKRSVMKGAKIKLCDFAFLGVRGVKDTLADFDLQRPDRQSPKLENNEKV